MASDGAASQVQQGSNSEDRRQLAEEAVSAALVVQAILKAAKGFALYLPNNPLYERFFDQLVSTLEAHLTRFGALHLDLDQSALRCRSTVIYENSELTDNLVFRMYADGIRSVQFQPGMESHELRAFVEIAAMPSRESDEDDVVTRLWNADLAHLKYVLVEDSFCTDVGQLGLCTSEGKGASGGFASISAAASRVLADRQAGIVVHAGLKEAPADLFALHEEEVQALQAMVKELDTRVPVEDIAAILRAILLVETDEASFDELVGIMVRLCADFLLTDRLEPCLHLQRVITELAFDERVSESHRHCLQEARSSIINEEVLAHLSDFASARKPFPRESLDEFVQMLGPDGVGVACVLLGEAESREARKVLMDTLVAIGASAPEMFFPVLGDSRWYLVRNAVIILRRIGDPKADAAVRDLAAHEDPRVRREVLHYFEEQRESASEELLLRFLEDSHLPLRVASMRSLARRHSSPAREKLLLTIDSRHFQNRDLGEREAICEALAELDPAGMLPRFAAMLQRRFWFRQEREFQETVCAVAGLRRIGTPEAMALMRKALEGRKGRARDILTQALRGSATSAGGESRG